MSDVGKYWRDSMNLTWESRSCPLCGSTTEGKVIVESNLEPSRLTEFAFASRKLPEYMHSRMVECGVCGLLYGTPAVSSESGLDAYKEAAFDSGQESQFAAQTYAKLVAGQLNSIGSREKALDIGAGDGAFLGQLVQLGFRAITGVEPSAAPIACAKPAVRNMIRHDIFRARDFAGQRFDLVTCFQVMEHLWNPSELARDVYSILNPGGVFVTVTHNLRALSARLLGKKSPIFDIEHRQLFSKKTIRALLQRAGFTDVRVMPVWNRYPIHYWMRLAPLPQNLKKSLIAAVKQGPLATVACSLRAGNIAAVARKPWR
jgi:SAM-dependent methyltransferase